MPEEAPNRLEEITALYKKLLKRDPDDSGLMSYFHSDLNIEEIAHIIQNSTEYLGLQSKASFDTSAKEMGSAELFVMGSSPKTDENALALKDAGIKSMLDLNYGAVTYDYTWCAGFLQVPVKKDEPLTKKQIDLCFDFIRKSVVEDGNKIFVHSESGVSRAPAIMALFLVADKGLSFYRALRLIYSKQPIINPSRNLVSADILEYVYKYRKKYGTVEAVEGLEVPTETPAVRGSVAPQRHANTQPPKEKSIIRVTDKLFAGPFMDPGILEELHKIGIKTILELNVVSRPPELQDSRFSNVHLPLFLEQADVLMPMVTKSINKYLEGGGLYVYCVDKSSLGAVLDSYVKSNPEILQELQKQKQKQMQAEDKTLTRM